MTKVSFPSFELEERLWSGGYEIVGGADEVGRGSFAGPVVAGVVSFKSFTNINNPILDNGKKIFIRDSKKLTELQRLRADEWIKKNAICWSVGEASVEEINVNGISAATFSAFRRAIRGTRIAHENRIQFLLVDAFYIPNVRELDEDNKEVDKDLKKLMQTSSRQLAVPKGDQRSFSISAASIIAKVYRDKLMQKLGKETDHIMYEWHKNKGYGTKNHREAIVQYGTTIHHRKKFVRSFLEKQNKKI